MKKSLLFLFFGLVSFVGFSQTYTVTNTNDAGSGSLRNGIIAVNAGTATRIEFKTGAVTTDSIKLKSRLPIITKPIDIDATTEQNYNPLTGPKIALVYDSLKITFVSYGNGVKDGCGNLGYNSIGEFSGLTFSSSTNKIKGLIFRGFTAAFDFKTISNNNDISKNVFIDNVRRLFWINGSNNNFDGNYFGVDYLNNKLPNGGVYTWGQLNAGHVYCASSYYGTWYKLADSTALIINGDNNDFKNNIVGENIINIKSANRCNVLIKGAFNNITYNKFYNAKETVSSGAYMGNPFFYTINIENNNNFKFENNETLPVNNNLGYGVYGIQIINSTNGSIKNNLINTNGFDLTNSNFMNFTNNTFSQFGGALFLNNSNNNSFINNIIYESGLMYFGIRPSVSYHISSTNSIQNKFSNNYFGGLVNFQGTQIMPISGSQNPSPTISQYGYKNSTLSLYGTSVVGDTIEFYAVADSAGGKRFKVVGRTLTDNNNNWVFTLNNNFRSDIINQFSAIAINSQGSTSDFGNIYSVCPLCPCEVTTIEDNGDNNNPTPGSLRAAIICANLKTEKTEIKFKLTGGGPYIINLISDLPSLSNSKGIILDGKSQRDFSKIISDSIKIKNFRFNISSKHSKVSNLSFYNVGLSIINDSIDFSNNLVNGYGVTISSGNYVNIYNNYILNTDYGLYFINSNVIKVFSNVFKNNQNYAIRARGKYYRIFDNIIFNTSNDGIVLDQCSNSRVYKNSITNSYQSGIIINSINDTIVDNIINGSKYYGIYILNKSVVFSNNIIENNLIQNCDSVGVYSFASKGNFIVGNKIVKSKKNIVISAFNQNKLSKNISSFSSTKDVYIDLLFNGNNSKPTPRSLTSAYQAKIYNFKGKSYPGDTIEVFLSNVTGNEARSYIARGVAQSDSIFSIALADSVTKKGDFYVAATATDAEGNTSELSSPVHVVICNSCTCIVKNTLDAGTGSLRQAITDANSGKCSTIDFNIDSPVPYKINLQTELPAISKSGLRIDGSSQWKYKAGTDTVEINGGDNFVGLNILEDYFKITYMKFSQLNYGIAISSKSDSIVINNNSFYKIQYYGIAVDKSFKSDGNSGKNLVFDKNYFNLIGENAIFLNGNNVLVSNNNIQNCGYHHNQYGVIRAHVGSSNSLIIRNYITNNMEAGILIQAPNIKISSNVIFNNGLGSLNGNLAIDLSKGPNNQPIPQILSHQINTNTITLTGKANSGDSIQVFVNDGFKENAVQYIPLLIKAGSDGNWSTTITAPYFKSGEANAYVATATDALGNTSQLSLPYKIGEFIKECIVTNTNDIGLGSLRDAINTCANTSDLRAKIFFKQPSKQGNVITISSPLVLANPKGIIIDAKDYDITIDGNGGQFPAFVLQGNFNSLTKLKVNNSSIGLLLNSKNNSIVENSFTNLNTGLTLIGSKNNIENNIIGDISGLAINVTNADSNQIQGNYIGLDKVGKALKILGNGIQILSSKNNIVSNNIIGNVYQSPNVSNSGNGIHLRENIQENTIISNTFGFYNNSYLAIDSSCIFSSGGSPGSGSFKQKIINNTFESAKYGLKLQGGTTTGEIGYFVLKNVFNNRFGIYNIYGINNHFSQNTFTSTLPNTKAISNLNGANNNKAVPTILYSKVETQTWNLVGKSLPGDTVEIFKSTPNNQVASKYIGFAITGTDSIFNAVLSLADLDKTHKSYFVATATDANGNTSELSNSYGFCEECVCVVKNTSDIGANSLREAIDLANNGECAQIKFNIPLASEYKITLQSELPSIKRPVVIDGTSQNGYDITKTPVIELNPKDLTLNGLTADYYYANVKGLYLNGFKTGVVINKSNNIFDNIVVGNSFSHQIIVKGKNNSITNSFVGVNNEGLSLTGKESGIYVNGTSNNIQFNTISNNNTDGIIVDKNSMNMILNNVFTNNGVNELIQSKAISLVNNGNYSQLAPTFSSNVVNPNNIVITGKAAVGDKIQVFTNNNLVEEAIRFVGEAITDAQNNWSITISSNFYTQGQNNYFVATATALNKGTSPLSKVYQVGSFPVSCFVTNTKNSGKGSLRAAVACVNTAGTGQGTAAQIIFSLPTNNENIINVIDNGFVFTNNFGVLVDPKLVPVTLKAKAGVLEAFNWKTKNFTVQNLTFKDFETALVTENSLKTTIRSNKFENNLVAIKVTSNDTITIQNNSIDGGNIGVWLNKSQGTVQGNVIGKVSDINSIGVYAQNCKGATIINNQIENINNVKFQGIDTLYLGNAISIKSSSNSKIERNEIKASKNKSAILVDNSASLSINSNTINNGKKGIWVNESKNISLSKNVLTNPVLFGIYLSSTTNTHIAENQVLGLTSAGKAIELQYNSSKESNKGKAIPKFKYATYKRGQLVIKGESQQNDKVEIFSTDVNGWDLKQHLSTVYADDYGNFEYKFKVNPSDINTYNFKATATISNWITNDTIYTSEASEKFNPNLKLCFVTNTDNDGKGSLRANIDSANIDKCNLMLFELSGTAPFTITPVSDLPIITAKELTIDATSQDGFVNNALVFVKDNLNASNALEVNSKGIVSVHGLGYDGYSKTVKITKVLEFEQTLNLVKNYSVNPYDLVSKKHKSITLDSNNFVSTTPKVGLKLNVPNVKLTGNSLVAGTDTALAIVSDSLLVLGNTISSKNFKNNAFAVFVSKIDSLKLAQNIISDYQNGIQIENAKNIFVIDNALDTSKVSTLGYSKAIKLIGSEKVTLQGNYVSRSDSSIIINNSKNIVAQGNILDSTKTDGIIVIKTPSTKLENNTISKAVNGIKLIDSKHSHIIDNTIFEFQNAGVFNDTLSTAVTIQKNTIGGRFTTISTPNRGLGIVLYADSCLVGGDTSVANYIFNNTLGGVSVYGKYNKIVGNSIYDNDTSAAQPVHFAIKHFKLGNELKSKPVIDSFRTVLKNTKFTVYGTAQPNDTIHIYRADGVYQNAKFFVDKTIANAKGQWSILVDTTNLLPKLKYQTFTLVSTATDALNNTSELSNMIYIGACFVKNQVDIFNNQYPAPNSFRQSVQCANQQNENTDIYFALAQNTSFPIYLRGQMLTLTNKYGVVFNAKNLLLDKNNVNVGYGAMNESSKFSTFWKIDSIVGPSQFKNLNVSTFDTALVLNAQKKPIIVQGFEFKNISKNAIVIGNKTTKTIISNSVFKISPTATYITALKKSDSLTIQNNKFINGNTAIKLANVSNGVIKFDTLSALETNITVSKSNNLSLKNTQIDLVDSKLGVLLSEVSGSISQNKFKGKTPLSLFEIFKSSKLLIDGNIQEDTCFSFANLQKSKELIFESNTISKASKAFILDSCQSIKIRKNLLNFVSMKAFDAVRSQKISFNYNIVSDIDKILKPINIHLDDASIVSNKAHADPVILAYNVKKAKEGDCKSDDSRLSIYLNGTSLPNDSIEIYFSDTLKHTLTEFVVKGKADKLGKWDILIPKEKYIKDSKWYHFIVTATDTLGNTSQTSNKYDFGKVVNQIIVKNTKDAGSFSLRDAIEKINCSNVYSDVRFEIDDENLHEIIINDTLPKISAYLGFSMDGATQQVYAINQGIKFANQQIIVKTVDNAAKYPVLTLSVGCDTSKIKSIDFYDCQKGLKILNNHNKFEQLHFVNKNTILSDTAITLVNSKENVFNKCNISGYKLGAFWVGYSHKNQFISDSIKNVKVAYLINKYSSENIISNNSIQTDSISIILNQTAQLNLLRNNTFGSDLNAIKYPSIYLKNASSQLIENNKFLWGAASINADSAFIVVKGKSNGNVISINKFGVDKKHDFVKTSNMKAIWMKPSTKDSLPSNNVIVGNEIVGINNVAIQIDSAQNVNINDNFIGIDSLFKGKDPVVDDYKAVQGVQREGVLITASSNVVINNNVIINYGTHGVNARKSSGVLVEKNKIFSENTKNKAINLNQESKLLATNVGLAKPQITDGDAIDMNTISISGISPLPNVNVLIYEAFADSSQSLRFIKIVQADASGNWVAQLPSSNFGFNKYNNYLAQISTTSASSEYSKNYLLSPPLCKLAGKIDLFDAKYTPCPQTKFTLDASLSGLDYEWKNPKITTITTQKAQLDSSGVYTLTIKDKFNCSITESFEVNYKPKPAEPIFIVSSGIYVGDTITIIDVSPNRPTSFDWSSNDNIEIISSASSSNNIIGPDGKTYPGGREVKFIVPDKGSYTITQRSKLNDCFVKVDKTVIATFKDPTIPNPYLLAPVIQSIVVYPVPVKQGTNANAFITTTSKEPVYISVIDMLGNEKLADTFDGKLKYNIPLKLDSLPTGVYIVRLETETQTLSYKIVIN